MSTDDQPDQLPDELARAFRRATDRTLGALTALRVAVREHVHNSRNRGSDLDEIQLQLKTMVARALDDIPTDEQADADNRSLTLQIVQWSETFYTEKS
jgi:hypothetical protein